MLRFSYLFEFSARRLCDNRMAIEGPSTGECGGTTAGGISGIIANGIDLQIRDAVVHLAIARTSRSATF